MKSEIHELASLQIQLRDHTTMDFNSDLDKPKSLLSCSSLPKESDVCASHRMTRIDHLLSEQMIKSGYAMTSALGRK
jgi:hypothetical protein